MSMSIAGTQCCAPRANVNRVGRRLFAILLLVAMVLSPGAAANATEAETRTAVGAREHGRVLVVYQSDPTLPAAREIAQGLSAGLREGIPEGLETYTEHLDLLRFSDPENLSRKAADMVAKYSEIPLDAVITIGPGAARFMLQHQGEIAPGAPFLFGGIREETVRSWAMPAQAMGVVSRFDVKGTVDLARRLQPGARKIVVLTGSSDFDRSWRAAARRDLASLPGDFDVRYLSDLPIDGFVEAVRQLTPNDILLILSVIQDALGTKAIPREMARQIAGASAAPSYGVYSTLVDIGIVGGHMTSFQSIGEDLGRLAVEAVQGNISPGRLVASSARHVVDWHQMLRWGFDATRLPADTLIENYRPSAWEQYRLSIIVIAAVIALQFATIAGLVVQYRRRRRIAEELNLERLELVHLSRVHQLGELSGAFAHELSQPLTSILANAEAGQRMLQSGQADSVEIQSIFEDIASDDRRAASIIRHLRRLMVKGEVKLESLDLNDAVAATLALANSEFVVRQTTVSFDPSRSGLNVRGCMEQLQQLVLNLLLNAAESMSRIPVAERRIEVQTRNRNNGTCEMSISDSGPGIPPELTATIFQPFVSTKQEGLGLGLAICRSIALAHGGSLAFDEERTEGARAVLTLPLS